MVIFFLEEDLVSFGKYMVSVERRELFENHPDPSGLSLQERLSMVHDADLANWALINNQVKDSYVG